jgi:hypothetical protein
MKSRWILASLTLMTLTAAGALAAEARPGGNDGQKTARPRVVSDRYTDGFRVLEFRGTPQDDGTLAVGLEYRRGSDAPTRVLVSTRRFKRYGDSLTAFFSGIEPDFLNLFRDRLPDVAQAAFSQIGVGDDARMKDRVQLVFTELGAFQYARKSLASRGIRELQDGADCVEIALVAAHVADCLVEVPAGDWVHCADALVHLGYSITDVSGCIDYILQLICESNGYPWKWIPGSGGYGDKCIECFDQDAHACDMVVSALDGGEPLGDGHHIDNQDPNSGGGGGSMGGFSFWWGPDGGTVTTQTCYCITLPDGSSYVSCH